MLISRTAAGGRRHLTARSIAWQETGKKGLFAKCVAFCEKKVPYLRADTHFDNHTMQHLLEKNSFERRGIIYLKNGDPRIAYQK